MPAGAGTSGGLLRGFWGQHDSLHSGRGGGTEAQMEYVGRDHGFLVKGHGTGQGCCPQLPQEWGQLLGRAPLVHRPCSVCESRQVSSCGPATKACGLWAQFVGHGLCSCLILHQALWVGGHKGLKKLGPAFQEFSTWGGRETRKGEQASSTNPLQLWVNRAAGVRRAGPGGGVGVHLSPCLLDRGGRKQAVEDLNWPDCHPLCWLQNPSNQGARRLPEGPFPS